MYLIYFDEAKKQDDHPHYHIGAVAIEDKDLHTVEERVAQVAEQAFGSATLNAETELHAVEIYNRKRNFKGWSDFEARLAIFDRLIDVLSMDQVKLIDIQINCDFLHENQSPADIAFMYLCERANDLVKTRNSLGMLIGDRESDQIAARYATDLSEYRAKGTDFAFGRDIQHLIDSVHFTHSHLSRLLQLADVYTWLLQFSLRSRESSNPRHKRILDSMRREGVNLFPAKYKEWPKR